MNARKADTIAQLEELKRLSGKLVESQAEIVNAPSTYGWGSSLAIGATVLPMTVVGAVLTDLTLGLVRILPDGTWETKAEAAAKPVVNDPPVPPVDPIVT